MAYHFNKGSYSNNIILLIFHLLHNTAFIHFCRYCLLLSNTFSISAFDILSVFNSSLSSHLYWDYTDFDHFTCNPSHLSMYLCCICHEKKKKNSKQNSPWVHNIPNSELSKLSFEISFSISCTQISRKLFLTTFQSLLLTTSTQTMAEIL